MKHTLLGVALLAGALAAPLAHGQSLHRLVFAAAGTQTSTLTFSLGEAFVLSPSGAGGMAIGAHPGDAVITAVDTRTPALHLALWPNPATSELRLTGSTQPQPLELLDVLSRPVFTGTLQPNQPLSVAQLPNGTYLARIGQGSSQRLQRVVISR